ncbi:NosD domain-containing protein [Paenarthrobacter nitroguajacolicus]|uniref:NosD domain-containing protein n=1 Tax=Paenarthrobacter nitroguajacolicus TaxID=211146 RepID=UPI00248BFF41|nr:NosD domain-containing protein [Paenarthrobacter nitroguajacolicus]MDI2033374.1 Inulin fructotransferase [DFA-I-forming] [Paenarthrobacter nitroguajacolicus]
MKTVTKMDAADPSRRLLVGTGAVGTLAAALSLGLSPKADAAEGTPLTSPNTYDVTSWRIKGQPKVTAQSDVGAVINDIIADIKQRQSTPDSRPGAVIIIPPGNYDLRTQVVVDVDYLTIAGFGHGFFSRSIKDNVDTTGWLNIQPGGSHIRVLTSADAPQAFLVRRSGSPRLSGIVFRDFCLDGVEFTPDANSYKNGRTGIEVASDNDSLHITGMGFVYLEHALIVRGADALRVHDNMIAECGNCVELTGAGQATIVSDNLMGAGPEGVTLLAENHEGLLVTGNNLFPRGSSLIQLTGCNRCSVTANRLQGFYPGIMRLLNGCKESLITSNHFRRGVEGFPPFLNRSNGLDDLYGVLHVAGDNNLVSNNLFAYDVPPAQVVPAGAQPTIVLVAGGDSNVVALNHVVSNVPAQHVVLDSSTSHSKVLDSGPASAVTSYSADTAIRPTP